MSTPDPGASLEDWLQWLEQLHSSEIDLGLERVQAVALRAGLIDANGQPPRAEGAATAPVVVTVGGTNGKGSVVSWLAATWRAAGYRVGAYTSPHLLRFNERIVCDGTEASSDSIRDALVAIEQVRGETSLTYFEFTTLAAMQVFTRHRADVIVLEVGLGGRLDAVNIWEPDSTVITSIGIDHEAWLGSDRNRIAAEKLGIARPGVPLVIGETDPPDEMPALAAATQAQCYWLGDDFTAFAPDTAEPAATHGHCTTGGTRVELPVPRMSGLHQYQNVGIVTTVVESLQQRLPTPVDALADALRQVQMPARFEYLELNDKRVVVDAAHNPAAARMLVRNLRHFYPGCPIHAVIGIMQDKAIDEIVEALAPVVSAWYCGRLSMPRALAPEALADVIRAQQRRSEAASAGICVYASVDAAFRAATQNVTDNAREIILVSGSFYTVSEVSGLCHS